MLPDEAVDCRYALKFPDAKAFPVDDVLNVISAVKNPCNHHPNPTAELTTNSNDSLAECKSGHNVCNQCAFYRDEEKKYLIQRLFTSVVERKFDLWNSFADKVKNPPVLSDAYMWAVTASIYRSDLIKFCRSEKIDISFENEQKDGQTNDQAVHRANESSTSLNGCIATTADSQGRTVNKFKFADYVQLAEAFQVDSDPTKNLNWFKNRCSDLNKYPAFKQALAIKGERGGDAAKFDVLLIAAHLMENRKIYKPAHYANYLRARISRCFPLVDLNEFDDRFDMVDRD